MEDIWQRTFNSLWPGRFWWNFRWALFKPITLIDGWDSCCEIALKRMSLDLTDDKSTLVQIMAWCSQATSHYLNQCWPRCLLLYGVTRPQLSPRQDDRHFPDDILRRIFMNENVYISVKISLKYVPKGPVNNIPALIQIMAWCCPLSESMMV